MKRENGDKVLRLLEQIRSDKVLRLAVLFNNGLKEDAVKKVLKRLKFDNDTLNKVTRLVRYYDYLIEPTGKAVRHAVNTIGEDLFSYYLEVCAADIMAENDNMQNEKMAHLDRIKMIYSEIIENGHCVSLKTLAVSGKDLIQAGMKPGKELGEKLEEFLGLVLDDPELNTKENLLSRL